MADELTREILEGAGLLDDYFDDYFWICPCCRDSILLRGLAAHRCDPRKVVEQMEIVIGSEPARISGGR